MHMPETTTGEPMRTPRQPSQHSANGQKWSFMDARPAAQGMYDPATSTTPAASASWPPSPARRATRWSSRRSRFCATWSTAAPPAPSPTRATARASCPRCPTPSSVRWPNSSCPRPARTPSASPSCPRTASPLPSHRSRRSPRTRASPCSAGARSRSHPDCSAPPPARRCPPSTRSSWPTPPRRPPRASTSTARRSCCASAPNARPASTSRRCPRGPSSTRAC